MKKTIFVIIFSFITNSNGFINASASEILANQQRHQKTSIKEVLFNSSYEIGHQIAEGLILSIVWGMSIVDDEL